MSARKKKPAPAPAPELTSEEKAALRREAMMHTLIDAILSSRRDIELFVSSANSSGFTEAISWRGGDVITAEYIGPEAWRIMALVCGDKADAEKLTVLRAKLAEVERELLGDAWFGGSGPWEPRSTSATHNLVTMLHCSAMRSVRGLLLVSIRGLGTDLVEVSP